MLFTTPTKILGLRTFIQVSFFPSFFSSLSLIFLNQALFYTRKLVVNKRCGPCPGGTLERDRQ